MNTPEQVRQAMAEATKHQKTYDEHSVSKAREKWLDARDLVQRIENGERSIYTLHDARQAEEDAKQELATTQHFAGHLDVAAQYREHTAKLEQATKVEQEREQAQFAKEEEERTKGEMLQHWLASGGTAQQFSAQWSDMWRKILADRAMANHDPLSERLKARYSGIQG